MVNGDCARRRCETRRLLWLVVATLVALEAMATAAVVIDQQITMPGAQGGAKTVTRTTMNPRTA